MTVAKVKSRKREAIWRMRRLVAVSFCYFVLEVGIFHNLCGGFTRTTIVCETPEPQAGKCPKGSTFVHESDKCAADPPTSKTWSLSPKCAQKEEVINGAKEIAGHLGLVKHLGMILAVIFLGPLVDTWGRKQVMMVSLTGGVVREICFLLASIASRPLPFILGGEAAFSTVNAYGVGMKAMATDLSPPETEARSVAFAALHMVFESAELTGFIMGYFLLKAHLTNYTPVFLVTFLCDVCIWLFAFTFLKANARPPAEKAPGEEVGLADKDDSEEEEEEEAPQHRNCALQALQDMLGIFKVVCKDRALQSLCVLVIFHTVSATGLGMTGLMLIAILGYSPEDVSMLGILVPCVATLGASLAPKLVHRTNAHVSLGTSMSISCLAMIMIGVAAKIRHGLVPGVLVWTAAALAGLARGLFGGTYPAMVSVRVKAGVQGRLFAFIHVCEYLAWAICSEVSHEYLFDAKWRGWKAGTVFFVCAGLLMVGLSYLYTIAPSRKEHAVLDEEQE